MDPRALALDDAWLDTLGAVADQTGLALPAARLHAEIHAVSEAYNSGSFRQARTRSALAARLMFFFPRDVPKVSAAVRELVAFGKLALAPGSVLRVLDVGAGLGASTWGLVRALAQAGQCGAVHAVMVDDDPQALAVARALVVARRAEGEVALEVTIRTALADIAGTYDVILVGQSLGEIDSNDAKETALLASLLDHLDEAGSLVVVEPALRDRTRRLHRVRDALVARGVTVFAPCLHAQPCPALAAEQAWCHEDLPVDLPARVASMARAAGLRWQGLTFSYLVLRKDGATLGSLVGSHAQRVVSAPIITKGKRELWLCAAGIRRKVARLDRDGTRRDAWATAERGAVLTLEPDPGASRVAAATRIVRRS